MIQHVTLQSIAYTNPHCTQFCLPCPICHCIVDSDAFSWCSHETSSNEKYSKRISLFLLTIKKIWDISGVGVHEVDAKNEMRSIHSQCDQPFEELGMEAIYLVGIHIRNSNRVWFFFFFKWESKGYF